MITTNKHRIIHFITLFVLSFIAIYVYTVSVVSKLDYFNTYQLEDSLFISSFFILIYMILSTVFITKITQNKWQMLLACLLYLVVLEETFYNLAFGLRTEFGTTRASMEVRLGLVLYYEHTLILLIVAACFYYLALSFLKTKNECTTIQDQLIKQITKAINVSANDEVVYKSEWQGYLPFGAYHWIECNNVDISNGFPSGWEQADIQALVDSGFLIEISHWENPKDEYEKKVVYKIQKSAKQIASLSKGKTNNVFIQKK